MEQLSPFLDQSTDFAPGASRLFGVEHEYRVATAGRVLDFRAIVHALALGQPQLDPGDLNAYRLPSGTVVTCDEREAELVLPSGVVAPGFTRDADARARIAHQYLQRALGAQVSLDGYSTHLSVSLRQDSADEAALRYTQTFAPGLMLLLDEPSSPGLLVRPRVNRLELCGEYAAGDRLRAALAFAVGSVRACARGEIPPTLALRLGLDDHRYGWYVDRRAFGPDLYRHGRSTLLRRVRGGPITAQDHLERCWEIAREALSNNADSRDLDAANRMVSGDAPLPCEQPAFEPDVADPSLPEPEPSVFGRILEPRSRPGFELAPVMTTWDVSVFVVVSADRSRRAFACVPSPYLKSFLDRLERGTLDAWVEDYLARPPRGRKLERHAQTLVPGLYDELGPRRYLLPLEGGPSYRRRRRLLQAHLLAPPELRPKRGIRGWARDLLASPPAAI